MTKKTDSEKRKQIRSEIVKKLGGKCVNCGFDDPKALQIDHVNRNKIFIRTGMSPHRDEFGRLVTSNVSTLKKTLNEIIAGSKEYQILCANCNWIKRFDNKEWGNKKIPLPNIESIIDQGINPDPDEYKIHTVKENHRDLGGLLRLELNEACLEGIRDANNNGTPLSVLAERFEVSRTTLWRRLKEKK